MRSVRMKRSTRAKTRTIARTMGSPPPLIKDGRCRSPREFLLSVIRDCLPCRTIGESRLAVATIKGETRRPSVVSWLDVPLDLDFPQHCGAPREPLPVRLPRHGGQRGLLAQGAARRG